jgi:hypothetical protein
VATYEHKPMSQPDETREFPNGRLDMVQMGSGMVGRLTLQPGWRWSEHVKPLAGTDWCEAPHFQYQVSGVLHVINQDGTEFDSRAGDVTNLPAGHDAYVVGNEPAVLVDFQGAIHYAEG